MPKIALLNAAGETEFFEPVDAREILATPDTEYTVDPQMSDMMGVRLDPTAAGGINIPQLQGADAEMQTGNSVDKYARQAVVKAIPGNASDAVLNDDGSAKPKAGKPVAGRKSKKAAADADAT